MNGNFRETKTSEIPTLMEKRVDLFINSLTHQTGLDSVNISTYSKLSFRIHKEKN